MIDYFQIQRIASQKEIPEEIIEKDYLIELLLFYIGKDNYFKKTIVFRGGTGDIIKKCVKTLRRWFPHVK